MVDDDGFLRFVESARQTLVESLCEGDDGRDGDRELVAWSWVAEKVLDCCRAYPSGVTDAIVLSDLFQAWMEKERMERRKMLKGRVDIESRQCAIEWRSKQQRPRLAKTVSIDSVLEKKFISLDAVLEAVIIDVHLLPRTSSYLLKLGDPWSSSSVDLYLHRRFYNLICPEGGVLKPQREIRLTGCRLRIPLDAATIPPRLLPTEYMSILLFEEHDDDAVLLGAQFFTDTFSSISLDPAQTRNDYCFYARLESIDKVETADQSKFVKMLLRDSNGDLIFFLLWDEQLLLVNLLSEGSMIALERPSVSMDADTGVITHCGFCLEHGSGTCIYTVPYVPPKEQVTLRGTQSQLSQHIAPAAADRMETSTSIVSRVTIPLDSQGFLNYANFPSRLLIENLHPKMSRVTLYGRICSIAADESSPSTFVLGLTDNTGTTNIKLLRNDDRSGAEIWTGHFVFISGLVTADGGSGRVHCIWDDSYAGSKLVNVTLLPALLSSSNLHYVAAVHKLRSANSVQVCRIKVRRMSVNKIQVVPSHTKCGRSLTQNSSAWSCHFCQIDCNGREVAHSFCATVRFSDASQNGNFDEWEALCHGQAAAEILQASPEDFTSWSEDERALFLCYQENKEYLVTLYTEINHGDTWGQRFQIARALKCE